MKQEQRYMHGSMGCCCIMAKPYFGEKSAGINMASADIATRALVSIIFICAKFNVSPAVIAGTPDIDLACTVNSIIILVMLCCVWDDTCSVALHEASPIIIIRGVALERRANVP